MKGVIMFDNARIKALKKQMLKKDEEIAALISRNEALEKENSALTEQKEQELAKIKTAAAAAEETTREFREKIIVLEKLHQKFLQTIKETNNTNEQYRAEYERLIEKMRTTAGCD